MPYPATRNVDALRFSDDGYQALVGPGFSGTAKGFTTQKSTAARRLGAQAKNSANARNLFIRMQLQTVEYTDQIEDA